MDNLRNIIVTGGGGFIGSNLALELQESRPEAVIYVIDDLRGSNLKNLEGFKGEFMQHDVARREWMAAFAGRPVDAVFHLASITDTTVLDEEKMMHDNVEGFRNVLELAAEKGAKIVWASSAAVYGSMTRPMREDDECRPNNVYGQSKLEMEKIARPLFGRMKLVGLRYFNVFGPRESFKGDPASMAYKLTLQMMAGKRPRIFKWGEQKRDFIYVKDVVSATVGALDAAASTIVNVGTGTSTSFNELIAYINEALGADLEPDCFDNPYDFYQDFTQADVSLAREKIGFKAAYTTREGVIDYVRKYIAGSGSRQQYKKT